MSSTMVGPSPMANTGPHMPHRPDIQQLLARVNFLRKNPDQQSKPNELEGLVKYLQQISQNRQQQQQAQQQQQQQPQQQTPHQPMANGHAATNGVTAVAANGVPVVVPPQPIQSPVSFTTDQISVLKAQITAFKSLSRGVPVPENVQQAMRVNNHPIADLEKLLQPPDTTSRIVDHAVKAAKAQPADDIVVKAEEDAPFNPADLPKGPFIEDDQNSGIYPYNSYMHPFTHLKRPAGDDPSAFATRLQRLLIPTIMPAGLDAHAILAERDRFIEARIRNRIAELEALPSTMGDGGLVDGPDADKLVNGHNNADDDKEKGKENDNLSKTLLPIPSPTVHGKLRALIELKSLKLLQKQRDMRILVSERLNHGSLIPLNRTEFRRTRKPTLRDARTIETQERKQRQERERRAKHKHVEQLNIIVHHGREVVLANRQAQDRVIRIHRAVLSFHQHTEKEEQKRIERISKERLKALKADNEEEYMKLIDTAKDTRITHLIRQTDSYLTSLAHAVAAQQSEGGLPAGIEHATDGGGVDEATFGARVDRDDEEDKNGKFDYYGVAHRFAERVTKQPNILVGGTLKDYQLKGLQWMVSLYNNRLNGILADEMGLGKTIQTISLIAFLIEVKRQRGPYLVIVPLSTMTNWSGEFAKWAPSIRTISYKGNPTQRRNLQGELRMGQFQVLLTTYEYIIKDRPHLSKIRWLHMIIDEGHRMKNTQSKLTQTLTTYYHSRYRLILTGTPLQNNLPELWALLNFALPKVFNSVQSFDEWFNTPFANSGTGDKMELNEEETLLIIRRLHKVLRPFLLRRLKKDVESELPDKVEKVIKVRMSALQSQLYKQMKKHKMIADGKDSKGKPAGVKGLSNELMQLRKICQHPFLFDSVEDKVNPAGVVDDKIIRASGKVELLSRILPKFFQTGHRVLIFFQMTKVMDIMSDFLKMMGWKHLRLDGGTKTEERASFVQLFNAQDSEYQVFILSTRAGGLGLNLQTADTVIIFDSDWNPHADLQAQDRAHRIGQTKAVLILRFITEKSVEEAMYSRARYKLDIDDKVIQAGKFDNKSTVEEQEEFLRSILEAADQEEDTEESGDMNDDEMNAIISRSEEEGEIFRQIDMQRERDKVEHWRAAGNRGKPPPPLMQVEELPDCYQTDEPFDMKETEEIAVGRGARKRNAVSYNDGLDDDTWAMALEEGEDLQELTDRTRRARATNKLLKEASNRGTPVSDTDSRGRRGRKPKAKTGYETPTGGKRKRGQKSMSVTPSIIDDDDDDDDREQKRRKTRAPPGPDVPPPVREKMKKAFADCHKAVMACEAEGGRKRCDLFKELPDRREYPDYYSVISQPICISIIRKRAGGNYYKNVQQYYDDWKLMFNNARTFNRADSWVYVDAEEMEKVFQATFDRVMVGLPGAPEAGIGGGGGGGGGGAGSSSSLLGNDSYDSALTPMDEDDRPPPPPSRNRRKAVVSDEEYLTPSDDE